MAKGLRSHVKKQNRAKLRSTIFGPAQDARNERLSAKLQELASQSKPTRSISEGMELDKKDQSRDPATQENHALNDMDIDSGSKTTKSQSQGPSHKKRSGGIRKISRRKEKNLSIFPKYRLKRHQKPSNKKR